jgi:hypothetical protein
MFLWYTFVLLNFKICLNFGHFSFKFRPFFGPNFKFWFVLFVRNFPKVFRNFEFRPFRPGPVKIVNRKPKPWLRPRPLPPPLAGDLDMALIPNVVPSLQLTVVNTHEHREERIRARVCAAHNLGLFCYHSLPFIRATTENASPRSEVFVPSHERNVPRENRSKFVRKLGA